jgi:hypothetical protein
MNKYIISISIIFAAGLLIFLQSSDALLSIPPTRAIATIASNDTTYATTGGYYNATYYADHLWIISDGSILIEFVNYTGGVQ